MQELDLDFNIYHDNESYQPMMEKVGAKLTYAFLITKKHIEEKFGKVQIRADAYISEKDKLRKIAIIVVCPLISLTLIEDKEGNVKCAEGQDD